MLYCVMIPRPDAVERVSHALRIHPVAALLGPRQVGKTTLARSLLEQLGPYDFFDLENPVDVQRLSAPMTVLEKLSGLIVIDEVQRMPALFELVRVLVDRPGNETRFLLLGSASPNIVQKVSETLAGRIGFIDLSGFDLQEVGEEHQDRLWVRGGFPRSFLAEDDEASFSWRVDFIRTFLERDIPQLGISIPAEALRRFWTMIAHFHAQIWNAAELARSIGRSENTARSYLDILTGAFVVRVLPPWLENLRKRQVKSPKIYLRDTGLLHALLQLSTLADVQGHPRSGASWEGFAMEQVLATLRTGDPYFWATHSGAELDLLVMRGGKRLGFEFKYTDAPKRTRSMQVAIQDLSLERLWVVYPGAQEYDLGERISVIPLKGASQVVGGRR